MSSNLNAICPLTNSFSIDSTVRASEQLKVSGQTLSVCLRSWMSSLPSSSVLIASRNYAMTLHSAGIEGWSILALLFGYFWMRESSSLSFVLRILSIVSRTFSIASESSWNCASRQLIALSISWLRLRSASMDLLTPKPRISTGSLFGRWEIFTKIFSASWICCCCWYWWCYEFIVGWGIFLIGVDGVYLPDPEKEALKVIF